jgi:hypothetical protein
MWVLYSQKRPEKKVLRIYERKKNTDINWSHAFNNNNKLDLAEVCGTTFEG